MVVSKSRLDRSPLGALLLLLALAVAATAWAADSVRFQVIRDTTRYTRIPRSVITMIEKGEAAFLARDAAALGPTLAEDYQWWVIGPQGPNKAIEGRGATVAMLRGFFRNAQWFGSKVYRLGMVGNLLIQVEVDKVGSPQGPVEKTSVEIYEFRDGLRWREWRFTPDATP
jgi:CO/xanthine dehydrogenase FAD-binding subunit